MDHAVRMSMHDCRHDLPQQAHRHGRLQRSRLQRLSQAESLDEGHREIGLPLAMSGFEDRNDAGMLQSRRRFGFGLESLQVLRRGELSGQNHLQRHDAIQPHVPRLVHNAHAAAAQLALNFVIADAIAGARPARFGGKVRCPGRRRWRERQVAGRSCPRGLAQDAADWPGQPSHPIVIGKELRQLPRHIAKSLQQLVAIRRLAILDRLQIRRHGNVETLGSRRWGFVHGCVNRWECSGPLSYRSYRHVSTVKTPSRRVSLPGNSSSRSR